MNFWKFIFSVSFLKQIIKAIVFFALFSIMILQFLKIIMFYFLEYSIKEISIELSIKENTIKSWLKRGKQQLKGYLDEK